MRNRVPGTALAALTALALALAVTPMADATRTGQGQVHPR